MSSSYTRTPLPSEPSQKAIEAHRRDPVLDPTIDPVSGTRKCFYCSNRAPLGSRLCGSCKVKHNESNKGRYHKLKSEGLCTICAASKPAPGLAKCQPCLLRSSANWVEAKRRHGVLCSTCKVQLAYDGTGVCQTCKDYEKGKNMDRKREKEKKTSGS